MRTDVTTDGCTASPLAGHATTSPLRRRRSLSFSAPGFDALPMNVCPTTPVEPIGTPLSLLPECAHAQER
jgi:hypothetical protein